MKNLNKLKKLISYTSKYKLQLIVILVITFLGMLAELLQPLLLGEIIDFISKEQFNALLTLILIISIVDIISAFLTYLSSYLMTKVGIKVSTELKTEFYNSMIVLPMPKYDSIQSGNLLTRYETDISNLSEFLSTHFVNFIMNFFSLGIILYFSFSINPVMTLIVIVFLPVSLFIERFFSNKIKVNIRKLRSMNDKYLTLFNETIKGINEIKHLHGESIFKTKMFNFQTSFMHGLNKLASIRNLGGFLKKTAFVIFEFVMLLVGIRYIRYGILTIGSFIAFTNYAARLNNVISAIIQVYGYFNEVTVSIERIEEVNTSFMINNEENEVEQMDKSLYENEITFQDVAFKYNENIHVFENLTLTFWPRKINIIIGDSGLGKSTIFKLILKLYKPQYGSIKFNDTDIMNISPSVIRESIAYAPHNPYFFHIPLSENIRIANPKLLDQELIDILKMVNLYDLVLTLPDGIETVMQEAGGNFSEGQKQRLNLARAIAKNPYIYLLDEPTSALDPDNRQDILKIIRRLSENSTIIMITHDRENLKYFNDPQIIEIDTMMKQST